MCKWRATKPSFAGCMNQDSYDLRTDMVMLRNSDSISGILRSGNALWVNIFLSLSLLWTACGGGKTAAPSTAPSTPSLPPTTPAGAIPVQYWGLHVLDVKDFPALVPYGEFRNWDTQAQWPQVETCAPNPASNPISTDPCFDWSTFDAETSSLLNNPFTVSSVATFQVNDIAYTLNRTPSWASPKPNDTTCNGLSPAPGQCDLPSDINADGSGTDATWKTWVTALATHTNGLDDPTGTYTQTHAHIKYYEPWNEWYRNPEVTNWSGAVSVYATYAQMLRLTEDARCIITGKGTIHNYPAAGASTPCTATAIDSSAMIMAPSSASDETAYQAVMQNFLYCNGTGTAAPFANSMCNWSGQNWGSDAVDIINFHFYASFAQSTPEMVVSSEIPTIRAFLDSTDAAKPLWNGEGSWGLVTQPQDIWANDPYAQAGFIPRMFALYWSAGVSQNFFYSYESFLFTTSSGTLMQPQATAWTTTYNWLVDGTPTQNPFCRTGQFGFSSTVYSCQFKRASGNAALLVWDAQYGPGGTTSLNCTNSATPLICGSTSITVPSTYSKDWIDMSGAVHPFSSTLSVGANPILLEAP